MAITGLSGCATLAGSFNPVARTDLIAAKNGFVKAEVPTSRFLLMTYSKIGSPGKPLTVYLEGDGLAWLSKNKLSGDPTPLHPLVFSLASMDLSPNVLYLARPCQYVSDSKCNPDYWSDKRYSEEVIGSMNEAIDTFMRKSNSVKIRLLGYSGAAAVALLIAERRQDVSSLRTIAGNLNPEAVNRYHEASPLTGSLDPLQQVSKIADLPQIHYVGAADKVIPPFIAQDFIKNFPNSSCVRVNVVPNVTHSTGWEEHWHALFSERVPCEVKD